ncbi:hypothetical protein RUM44_009093 [Polyplax serrata]|uniref:Uncharacterized protein n=1 Tax=Polyplax serrata TaxID=468196 RepID=A0ABR1ARQ4_POLSC
MKIRIKSIDERQEVAEFRQKKGTCQWQKTKDSIEAYGVVQSPYLNSQHAILGLKASATKFNKFDAFSELSGFEQKKAAGFFGTGLTTRAKGNFMVCNTHVGQTEEDHAPIKKSPDVNLIPPRSHQSREGSFSGKEKATLEGFGLGCWGSSRAMRAHKTPGSPRGQGLP